MRVLIADDNPVPRLMLESLLKQWGYEVVVALDGAQAWKILQEDNPPRLAILDWMMPGMTGPEVCLEARKRIAHPYAYMLLLTSRENKGDVIRGLEAGADDYLTKPFVPEELHARLRTGLRILELEDKLVASQEVLQHKATHDELTGLLNRASIDDIIKRELARAKRAGASCGILLADLDHFKSVNDTHGHGIGDAVLREAASRLQAGVRVYDGVGRYGGEEFLMVLPGCNAAGLRERAERILDLFRASPFATSEGPIRVTISLGAVSSEGSHGESPEAFVLAADRALYRAKRNGRDRVEVSVLEENVDHAPVQPVSR